MHVLCISLLVLSALNVMAREERGSRQGVHYKHRKRIQNRDDNSLQMIPTLDLYIGPEQVWIIVCFIEIEKSDVIIMLHRGRMLEINSEMILSRAQELLIT